MNLAPKLKAVALSLAVATGGVALEACGAEENKPTPHDKRTSCLKSAFGLQVLDHVLDVPSERFKVAAHYSTDYDVDSWKITDTKAIDIKLKPVADSQGHVPQVLVENVHADASIKATKAGLNGIKQDTFDDHLHAGTQPGFEISSDHPYTERFVIEGYSDTLTTGWSYIAGGYGTGEIDEKKLTEGSLRDNGATGEEITLVADLLIKDNPNDPYFHKEVAHDNFVVRLKGKSC